MERKLASVQIVAEVQPIEGADAIEKVRINGWWCVAKKGEFSVGQKVVYLEVDSWVPTEIAPFLSRDKEPREFEGVKGERLRTVKLRGQVSQGLVLPYDCAEDEGHDLTEELGVLKWERPMSAQLAGQARGYFPEFLRKTDQERIQNCMEVIGDTETTYEVTLKLDGSSCTVYHKDGEVGVCSRNLELKMNEENAENSFVKTAHSSGLVEALAAYGKNIAVQGELMGPNIQCNREKLSGFNLFVFDVWDIDDQRHLTPAERLRVTEELYKLGFCGSHVPVVYENCPIADCGATLEELLAFADRPSLNHSYAEGVVFKAVDGSRSFKVINNRYLLKED